MTPKNAVFRWSAWAVLVNKECYHLWSAHISSNIRNACIFSTNNGTCLSISWKEWWLTENLLNFVSTFASNYQIPLNNIYSCQTFSLEIYSWKDASHCNHPSRNDQNKRLQGQWAYLQVRGRHALHISWHEGQHNQQDEQGDRQP